MTHALMQAIVPQVILSRMPLCLFKQCRFAFSSSAFTPTQALSLTQDSRLNYIQQHAERIGVDAGRLDSVRVSAARSSPMGDTLELCARYADAASVEALVPRLVPLVSKCTRGGCPALVESPIGRVADVSS